MAKGAANLVPGDTNTYWTGPIFDSASYNPKMQSDVVAFHSIGKGGLEL